MLADPSTSSGSGSAVGLAGRSDISAVAADTIGVAVSSSAVVWSTAAPVSVASAVKDAVAVAVALGVGLGVLVPVGGGVHSGRGVGAQGVPGVTVAPVSRGGAGMISTAPV